MKRRKFISVGILAYVLVIAMLAAAIGYGGIGSADGGQSPNGGDPPEEPMSPATTTRSVLVELFTGTWCTFCRGAEGALDKLADEYYRTQLSILEYHVGASDPFQVAGNSARASYYGVTGYPTSFFDGIVKYVGGSTNPDDPGIYNAYKTRIDNRLAIPSPVTVTVTGSIGGGSGSIDADITAIDDIPPGATDLVARFVLYEDHNYSYYPPSQPTWEFRLRMTVVENMPVESITLTKEQTLSFNKPFTIDPAWDLNKLGAVVFVQSDATKEVLASTSLNLSASSLKPDLAITPQDISFSNPTPQDGDAVTIYATARNVGTTTTPSNVNVRFYDGDPGSGGTQIGTDQNAGVIAAGGSSIVQVDWDTTGLPGDHEICVVVDEPNSILEHENENNNIAPKSITVSSSPVPPYATSWSPTGISEPVNTDFDVQWTRVMNWNSVNSSFSYSDGMSTWLASDGSFTHNGATRTSNFNPTADLQPGTTYTVTFDTSATDQAGNPLDQDQDGTGGEVGQDELIWQFTTAALDLPPAINAWEPGGSSGQTYIQGDIVDITWSANDDSPLPANPINLTYGSGAAWNPIATGEANDGIYAWDTSGVPCPNAYWINASVYDSAGQTTYDESTFSFILNCVSDIPPTVEAWEPGGTSGQVFIQGDIVDVTWFAADDNPLPANPVNISYGSGAVWNPIASDEANDGIYLWDTSGVPCPNTYWMNISVYDSTGQNTFDESNFSFSLDCPDNPPIIEAWEPGATSGQTFIQGEIIEVTWSATDDNPLPPNPINISYGLGAVWNPIANDEANDGVHAWDTSAVPCPGTYWMNVSAYDSAGQTTFDESNFSFILNCVPDDPPAIQAWEPGGTSGQTYVQGDIVDVRWLAGDDNPLPANPINISYGSGAAWSPIANDEADDGIYTWDTSAAICPGSYRIRVSLFDSIGQTAFDNGNYSFTIFCPGDSPPAIEAYEPGDSSGQTFTRGDLIDITWDANDDNPLPMNPINITYGSGAAWNAVASDEANDGLYAWDTSSVPCPGVYWMNLSVYDSAGQTTFDESNYSFTLNCVPDNPPAVEAWEPGGTSGQSYLQGDTVQVTWTASDDNPLPANPISILYGSGASWSSVANSEMNDGSYMWDTASVPCPGTYFIRLTVIDSIGQTAFDDGNFGFDVSCPDLTAPEIVSTAPVNGASDISATQQVVVTFSEPIDTSSFAVSSSPDPGGWSWLWSAGNTVATGTHAGFTSDTDYTFTVARANDTAGNQLAAGAIPNPWSWTTVDTVAPGISDLGMSPSNPDIEDDIRIYATVTDTGGAVIVKIIARDPSGATFVFNATMQPGSTQNEFYLDIAESAIKMAGTYSFVIWANDESGNFNSTSGSFVVSAAELMPVKVTVKVQNRDGTLLHDAKVEVRYSGSGALVTTGTTLFGSYMIDLYAGDYTFSASIAGYSSGSETLVLDGTESYPIVTITLDREDYLWLWILLAVIIIVASILIIVFLLKRRKKRSEPTTEFWQGMDTGQRQW